MRSVGLICEYNPLHRGHAYLIQKAREFGVVVCVMSGNFVQRGEAALLPPTARAAMALSAGADLVLELPFPFACASARYFATAGVRALLSMGCEGLTFGSESADAAMLFDMADRINERAGGREGLPAQMGDAAAHFATLGGELASNDILACEYIAALKRAGGEMEILPVKREGALYTQTALDEAYPSATALRKLLGDGGDITPYMPPVSAKLWQQGTEKWGIADTARLGPALLSLLRAGGAELTVADGGGGLMAHLAKAAHRAVDYASLCAAAATKRYTDGRLRRVMLYALAGVRPEDLCAEIAYLRLLAANERGRAYLAATRKRRTVCVATKPADVAALGERAARQRLLAERADGLFAQCLSKPTLPRELTLAPPFLA